MIESREVVDVAEGPVADLLRGMGAIGCLSADPNGAERKRHTGLWGGECCVAALR